MNKEIIAYFSAMFPKTEVYTGITLFGQGDTCNTQSYKMIDYAFGHKALSFDSRKY
ncbi:MAG: hypothetical protein HFE34_05060 [Clostridia bacterium]|nr:hypothetical protein [Clostridia bacterium]